MSSTTAPEARASHASSRCRRSLSRTAAGDSPATTNSRRGQTGAVAPPKSGPLCPRVAQSVQESPTAAGTAGPQCAKNARTRSSDAASRRGSGTHRFNCSAPPPCAELSNPVRNAVRWGQERAHRAHAASVRHGRRQTGRTGPAMGASRMGRPSPNCLQNASARSLARGHVPTPLLKPGHYGPSSHPLWYAASRLVTRTPLPWKKTLLRRCDVCVFI